jgi:hypothetical protein
MARRTTIAASACSLLTVAAVVCCVGPAFAQEEAPVQVQPPPPPPIAAAPNEPANEPPLAGFHNGLFYIRDRNDVFRLYVQGRLHVDGLASFGPGVSSLPVDAGLEAGFFLRRVRTEIGGEFFEKWQWQLSAEFAPTTVDNLGAKADTRACTIDPTTGAQTCTDQTAPVQAPSMKPAPTDAFVNYAHAPWLNVQAGQYLVPFGMEARISDNTTAFLERSMTVRTLAAPTTRDIGAMVWGETPSRLLYWTAGIYNGDGQNRLNVDGRFDFVGHAIVRPFAPKESHPLADAQLGVSFRGGSRDSRAVGYDITPLTTQGGYAFFRPTYKDSQGRLVHILPSTQQEAIGADLFLPFKSFDLSSEIVYLDENTREAIDGYQLSGRSERAGRLRGYGWYLQGSYWIFGPHELIGHPSVGKPLHLDLTKPSIPATTALQVLAKVEELHLNYSGSRRSGTDDPLTPTGNIEAIALSLGATYWATRHVRLSINYSAYLFPDSEPVSASQKGGPVQSQNQRAMAPGQLLAKGADDSARDGGHELHEVQARVGIQF